MRNMHPPARSTAVLAIVSSKWSRWSERVDLLTHHPGELVTLLKQVKQESRQHKKAGGMDGPFRVIANFLVGSGEIFCLEF
jgi:hypothetical protein